MIEFGQEKHTDTFCPTCGLPLLLDGKCKRFHTSPKKERSKEQHGKSKSPQRWYNYEQGGINGKPSM